ncbi:hypothetical protein B4U79_18531 [Dinothrombium tinctorium]|uniref:Uncharacterized protein n=1 Tax=Dinothrombium tinctorium TaxID=1965070 RepID=A0A443QG38_9ACAR|nr:hypothetical protein B4U79_18531 [Dinothrombium tinctorium]
MLIEYVCNKLSRVRWRPVSDALIQPGFETSFICGTVDGGECNKLMLWSLETSSVDESVDICLRHELPFRGDVTQIIAFDNLAFVTSNVGTGNLYRFSEPSGKLIEMQKWDNLDAYGCTDAVYAPSLNSVIICGKEGAIRIVDINSLNNEPKKSKILSQTSLECIEFLSQNEVIVGNESGHLKVLDLRTNDVSMSLGYSLCIVSCVKKNPSNNHIIASGNDVGVVSLWDLRNNASHLLHISAHSSLISELHYKENENNTIITSSYDGQLLKWILSPSSQFKKVDSIMGKDGDSPINSFHININNDLIFSTDNEALYFGQL